MNFEWRVFPQTILYSQFITYNSQFTHGTDPHINRFYIAFR